MMKRLSAARKSSDYQLGGQLLLWAARHWVLAYRRGRMVQPCVWQSFAAADLERTYANLCHLLRIVTFRELTLSAVRGPAAPRLSQAERQFMAVFETMEREGPEAAQSVAERFASPAIAREIVATALDIVRELGAKGQRIASPSGHRRAAAMQPEPVVEAAFQH